MCNKSLRRAIDAGKHSKRTLRGVIQFVFAFVPGGNGLVVEEEIVDGHKRKPASVGGRCNVGSLAGPGFNAFRASCPIREVLCPMLLELGQRRHTRRFQSFVGLDLVHQWSFRLVCHDIPTAVAIRLRRCRCLTSRTWFRMVLKSYARDRLTIYRGGPPKPLGGFSRIFDMYDPPCR